ncbi:hypothetical protein MRB53_012898 [Persea americana]|uniref:Uncharacterized protein n=1 Tax=Persea americana TaxID=3435 RepID=A0ACC2LZX4_PERAE|nr:hypothetical protein MRB53_012898 [Persea americana]
MESSKARILIIGATGYIGKRLVKASLALGHPTTLLYRPQIVSDPDKVQTIIDFKMQGATLLQGSLDDHDSLVRALKQVDIVVSAAAAPAILEQLNLIDAIKQVGTIKRFLPSEFGMDPDRMLHTIPPGDELFKHKQVVRRAIEKAHIPYTYVSANCLAGIFLAGLAQLGHFMPPTDTDPVIIYGNGDKKCIWINEDDMAWYTIMAVDDPRTLNKTLYLRPSGNILTQLEVVRIWENIMGKELKKTFVSEEDWLATLDKVDPPEQVVVTHLYQIFHRGDLYFKVEGPHGMDSNDLYPDYKYMTAEEYLKRFA